MAAHDQTSSAGRRSEADRSTLLGNHRVLTASWLLALGVFVGGWIAGQALERISIGVALSLQVPLVVAMVMTVQQARRRRTLRVAWLAITASLAFAAGSGVAFSLLRSAEDMALRWTAVVLGGAAELSLGAAALLLLRGRRHRLPFTWALDLKVATAGGVTYALLMHRWSGQGEGSSLLHVGELAFGMAATLILVQVVIAGAARDRVIVLLVGALALRQVALAEQSLALRREPPTAVSLWLHPAWAWLAYAVALGALAFFAPRSAQGWTRRRLHAFSAGSWTVPALCMALAVGVLVWFARHDGPRPTTLVTWAGLTLGLGLIRAVLSGRDLERLGRLASATHTDELSGLLNRRAITDELTRACSAGPGAVLLIDVDRFRDINQYLGHEAADDVLRQLGERLLRHGHPDEVLGRLGADEFVLVTNADTPLAATAVARRVRGLVEVPFQVGGDQVRLDLSVGVALWGDDPPRVDQLLSQAHEARRQARDRGTSVERWDPERDALATRRLALADSLRRCVRREELLLHYQPKLNTTTGEVIGVEALARWDHDGEMVSPELFISMAEEGGLITDLTRSLLDQALGQLARWDEAGFTLSMAVNLSPRNLLDPALPRRVMQLLERHGIAPHRLVLEITETTLMPDRRRSVAVLERLRQLGVRLSIDDYGTGHAALTYLRDFSVDELKLDRSYVSAMLSDERTLAIVESTVSMGRQLGLVVVAEGVERDEEVEALGRCGCEIIQGYLVCAALPADELTEWLQQRGESHPTVSARR